MCTKTERPKEVAEMTCHFCLFKYVIVKSPQAAPYGPGGATKILHARLLFGLSWGFLDKTSKFDTRQDAYYRPLVQDSVRMMLYKLWFLIKCLVLEFKGK